MLIWGKKKTDREYFRRFCKSTFGVMGVKTVNKH